MGVREQAHTTVLRQVSIGRQLRRVRSGRHLATDEGGVKAIHTPEVSRYEADVRLGEFGLMVAVDGVGEDVVVVVRRSLVESQRCESRSG